VNGIGLAGAGGVGAATIALTGSGGDLYVFGNTVLSSATLDIGSAGGDILYAYDTAGTGTVLTLDASTSLVQVGAEAQLLDSGYAGDGVVNNGTILAGAVGNGDTLLIATQSFVNQGSMGVGNGGWLDVDSG